LVSRSSAEVIPEYMRSVLLSASQKTILSSNATMSVGYPTPFKMVLHVDQLHHAHSTGL